MSENTIDTLELEVQSTSTEAVHSLEQLEKRLISLGSTFKSVTDGSVRKYAKEIGALSVALKSLSSIKIDSLKFDGAYKDINRLDKYISTQSKKMAKDFKDAFDFDVTSAELQKQFEKMGKLIANGQTADAAKIIKECGDEIINTSNGIKMMDDQMKAFYDTVNSVSKIKISPEIPKSLPDDWKHMNGMLRQKMSTKDGIEIDSLFSGWKDQFKGLFGDLEIDTVEGQFKALNEIIRRCQEGITMPVDKGMLEDSVYEKILADTEKFRKRIVTVQKVLSATDAEKVQGSGVSALANDLQKLAKVNHSGIATIGSAMESLSNGLNGISNLTLNAEPIVQLLELSKKVGNKQNISATNNLQTVGKNLQTFSESVQSLSGLNSFFQTIGSIDIKDGNLTKAVNALSRLVSLDTSGFNSSVFGSIQGALTGIANVPDVSNSVNRFVSSMSRLANAGTATEATAKSLPVFGKNLKKIVSDFSQVGAISSSTNIFVQSLAKLASSGKNIQDTVANLDALGKSVLKFMETMKDAPKISKTTLGMIQALAQLSGTGANVEKATTRMASGLNKLSRHSGKTLASIKKLGSGFKSLLRQALPFVGLYEVFNVGKKAVQYASDLKEVQNVVNVTFGQMTDKVEKFADTSIQSFGMSELSAKQYASRFQAMGTNMGIGNSVISQANTLLSKMTDGYVSAGGSMADMSLNLTKLTADMASFYNVEQRAVAEDLSAIFTGEARPLRTYGLDLTQATLAEWAMKNGLDANIKSMSQAEKTMLRYQYVMANTTAAHGDFLRTSGTWANQVRILKQSFQQLGSVVGGTLINAFKPLVGVMNAVMIKIISFVETISNALGRIFGWKIEIDKGGGITNDLGDISSGVGDVSDGAGGAADNIGQAADNMKKLRDYTLGIDELNIISPEDIPKGGGAGGSGGGAGGIGGLGGINGSGLGTNLVKTETIFDDYKSSIDTLYKLGDYIGTTLKNTLKSIDWNSVYESARGFGKGLADFLNGLISPELFYEFGKTVANSLNTILNATLAFGNTFDFSEYGLSIAENINGFFANFDFGLLAENINTWVKGIYEVLKTALQNIDWGTIWEGIKEFFSNIELETVGIIIGALTVKGVSKLLFSGSILKMIGGMISKKTDGIEITPGFSIKKMFKSDSFKAVIKAIGTVAKVAGGVIGIVSGILTALNGFFKMWEEGWSWAGEILKDIGIILVGIGAVLLGAPALVTAVVAGIVGILSSLVIVIHDNWDSIVQFFSDTWEKIKEIFKDVKEWFAQKFEDAKEAVKTAFDKVSEWFSEQYEEIKEVFADVKEWFGEKFRQAYESVKSSFKFIGSWFGERWLEVKTAFAGVKQWFSEKFSAGYQAVKEAFKDIKKWFSEKWESVKEVFSPVTEFFRDAFQNAYSAVTKVWDGIKKYFTDIANKIISPIGKAVNGVIDGINWVLDKVGSGTKLKKWPVPQFANGSSGIKQDTLGMVNDQKGATYKEMIVPPNGKAFIPKGRNVVLPLTKGTKIMPANQTKEFLKMPHFRKGIGDFFGGAWSAIKKFTGNVMDYLQNPGDILKIAIDKFTDMAGVFEPFISIAKGAVNTVFNSAMEFIKGKFANVVPKVSYNPSGGVEQWRNLAAHALKLMNQYSAKNLDLLLFQMQTESGGNPNAINNWDSNAKKGTPSKGLMQVIDPTFRAYAVAPYNKNVYDPLSNMLASIRYTISRYGSLAKGWKGHGYASGIGRITFTDLLGGVRYMANGGMVNSGELFMAREDGPELISRVGRKSNVMNNNQIVESITGGVYKANAEQNRLLATLIQQNEKIIEQQERLLHKDTSVNIDGNRANKLLSRARNNSGYNFSQT